MRNTKYRPFIRKTCLLRIDINVLQNENFLLSQQIFAVLMSSQFLLWSLNFIILLVLLLPLLFLKSLHCFVHCDPLYQILYLLKNSALNSGK